MTNYTRKALWGTAVIFFMTILAAGLGYLFRLLLARNLTKVEYGLFYAVFALIGMLSLFRNLGLGEALIKFIPEFLIKKRKGLVKSSIITVLLLQLLSSTIIVLIFIFLSGFLSRNYFHNPLSVLVLNILLIGFLLSVFEYMCAFIFLGFQKIHYLSLIDFTRTLLVLIITFILFYFQKSIYVPSISYILAYLLVPLIYFSLLKKTFPEFLRIKAKFSKKLTKKLISFGIPVSIGAFGWLVLTYTDTLTLTYFKGLEQVALYNVALPIAGLLWYFSRSITTVIFPMSSELWIKKKEYLQKGVTFLQKYSFALVIPFALIMFSFPEIIIRLLFGESYVPAASALKILAIGTIIFTVASINSTVINAVNKPKLNTKIILMGAVLNIILNFILIPKFGIVGAALATSTSYLLILLISTYKLKHILKNEFQWFNWLKSLGSGAIFVFVIWILKRTLYLNAWLELAICIVVALIIYILLLFLFKIIDKKEIKEIMGNILPTKKLLFLKKH